MGSRVRQLGPVILVAVLVLAALAVEVSVLPGPVRRFAKVEEYLSAGKDAKAAKEVAVAVSGCRDRAEGLTVAIALYVKHGRLEDAERLTREALDHPRKVIGRNLRTWERVSLLNTLAGIQYEQGRLLESAEPLRKALALDPNNAMLRNNLAYRYAEADANLRTALVLAKQAHAASPNTAVITDTLGWVYYKLGEYADAVDLLREAVKTVRDDAGYLAHADLRYHLGAAYAKAGEKTRAAIELRKALILNPSMTEARRELNKLNRRGPKRLAHHYM